MPKSKNRGHRESRKPQQELPEVPDLGNLSMPRKGNRSAAKYVASVGLLWDRRRADRKAKKNALVRRDAVSANPRRQHLDKAVRERMLRAMNSWAFDHQVKAFVPKDRATPKDVASASSKSHAVLKAGAAERLEELLDAVIDLGPGTVVLRVSDLSMKEAARVRGYLERGSTLFVVNMRMDEPANAY